MKYYVSDENLRFQENALSFRKDGEFEMRKICVYPTIKYQEILGMGGAFTEAASYTFQQMTPEKQEELLNLYFDESGNQYNFCRTHIQSCDFALGNYAYIEDSTDKELKTFSIDRDKEYIIPFIKKAQLKNKDIKFLSSPWSPPAFMKTNNDMNHGGKLKEEYKEMWASMMVRYIREYEKEGITIERVTVQNEPAAVQTWDSCIYSGAEEAEFAVKYLRPALDKAGYPHIKINVWDHNKDIILERAHESFEIPGADKAIDGIAFHWYTGDYFEALEEVHRQHVDKELIFTEGCVEYSRFETDNQIGHAEMYAHDIIGNFNAGMNGYIDWNLLLDEKGGPNHVGNLCDAPIMYDKENDILNVNLSYYYIGHFSRFVKPGAKRILATKYTSDLEATAFENKDGSKVLVVLNRTEKDIPFAVSENGIDSELIEMKKHSMISICW